MLRCARGGLRQLLLAGPRCSSTAVLGCSASPLSAVRIPSLPGTRPTRPLSTAVLPDHLLLIQSEMLSGEAALVDVREVCAPLLSLQPDLLPVPHTLAGALTIALSFSCGLGIHQELALSATALCLSCWSACCIVVSAVPGWIDAEPGGSSRQMGEWHQGHFEVAQLAPLSELQHGDDLLELELQTKIYLHCAVTSALPDHCPFIIVPFYCRTEGLISHMLTDLLTIQMTSTVHHFYLTQSLPHLLHNSSTLVR